MKFFQETWARLSQREQWMIGWGAVITVGLILYNFAVDPLLERMNALNRLIPQKRQELEQLERLREAYDRLKGRLSLLDQQAQSTTPDFSLLAFVEATVQERVGKAHLAGIRPQSSLPFEGYEETVVEVQLEKVSLGQVVAFLAGLEQSPYRLRTKRLDIKSRFKAEELLDAKIEVAVYQRKLSLGGAEGERSRQS